jgi:hypothetical protein
MEVDQLHAVRQCYEQVLSGGGPGLLARTLGYFLAGIVTGYALKWLRS